MVKFLLLCASVAIQASHAGATASLRTDRGQLIFDLGSNITSDAEASIRVIRGSEEVCTVQYVQRTTCILSLILFNLHLTLYGSVRAPLKEVQLVSCTDMQPDLAVMPR